MTVCAGCGERFGAADRFCEACGLRRPDPRDHQEQQLAGLVAVSDRGLRHQHNEDAFAVRRAGEGLVSVVCDGVSSGPRPAVASAEAAAAGADALVAGAAVDPGKATEAAILAAQAAVASLGSASTVGSPACTFVSAICLDGEVTVGWVGDSRAYWLPVEGVGALLTEDDSWLVATVATGKMTAARAAVDRRAHALLAWLGADARSVKPRVATLRPTGPGLLLLCSDGLWNYLPTPERLVGALPDGVAAALDDPLSAARALVGAALDRGGRDNITVALTVL